MRAARRRRHGAGGGGESAASKHAPETAGMMVTVPTLWLLHVLLLIGGNAASTWHSINAVTLGALNMEASIAFYASLGLESTFASERFATMSAPVLSVRDQPNRLNINLFAVEEADASSLRSCYSAAVAGRTIIYVDDVDAVHAAALAAGLFPLMNPSDAPWGERYFHIDDPSGHQIAIAKPLPEESQVAAMADGNATLATPSPSVALVALPVTVLAIVLLSACLRLHPFFALMGPAIAFGSCFLPLEQSLDAFSAGLARTTGSVGVIILCGSVIGAFLGRTNAVSSIASHAVAVVGDTHTLLQN